MDKNKRQIQCLHIQQHAWTRSIGVKYPVTIFCKIINLCGETSAVTRLGRTGDWMIPAALIFSFYAWWCHQMENFPRYWPFAKGNRRSPGIHRSPVNSPHKGQWREVLCFLWSAPEQTVETNNRDAGDLRRHREVQVVHISRVIIAYTLESLSSLTQITHNPQAIINFKKTGIKKEQLNEDTH